MWKAASSLLALAVCILLLVPGAGWSQDRVGELEKKVQDLEKQLLDLKQVLEAEKAAVPPLVATSASPSPTSMTHRRS